MVVDKLVEILEPLVNNQVYRQGSFLEGQEYPNLFITFWENESSDKGHYDNNKTVGYTHDFDVNVYGNNSDTVYNTLEQVITTLKNNGFIVDGKGIDVPSDEPNYKGRHINAIFVDYGKEIK